MEEEHGRRSMGEGRGRKALFLHLAWEGTA